MRWNEQLAKNDSQGRLPGMEDPPVVRTFEAPEAVGIRFHEVRARSALNSVPAMARLGFSWTVNPYRGCTHACSYCFARPTHRYLELDPRRDFERQIVVKVNLPEVLGSELRRPTWRGEHVALGTNTDPYQWVEGRYGITRGVWEQLLAAANPCSILTKSPLLLRDLDLFRELNARTEFRANLSIPTLDERTWRLTEPGTPHPRKRIDAIAELRSAGIAVGVLVAPLMPGLNDSPKQIAELLRLCGEAGADSIGGIGLHLRGELKEIFLDWLAEHRPELLPRYRDLYARSGNLPRAERLRLRRLVGSARAGRRSARATARPSAEPSSEGAPADR